MNIHTHHFINCITLYDISPRKKSKKDDNRIILTLVGVFIKSIIELHN